MVEEIFVYLDEGALDAHKDKATKEVNDAVPSIAAVVLHNPDSVREKILTLERKLLLDPSFRLEGNASRFKSNGFHHTHDPTVARVRFTEAMSNFSFSWYSSSFIDSRPKPLYRSIEEQYAHLIRAIAQKFHNKHISFVFEQNTSLNKKYNQIVEQSLLSISSTLPGYKVSIAGKEERLLSLPDYCIAISADAIRSWKRGCCDLDALRESYKYRNFLAIEPKCSLLFAFDLSRPISKRENRLRTHTYNSMTGRHSETCSMLGA